MAAEQQNQWTENLQQIQNVLLTLTRQFAEDKRQSDTPPPLAAQSAVAAVALGDPVLESVVAQFEILQRDRFRRRPEEAESAQQDNK